MKTFCRQENPLLQPWIRALAALAMSLCVTAAAAEENTARTKTFKKPPEGPALSTPVDRGQAGGTDAAPGGGTDLAYGAFQRGFYLTALQLALPRAETGDPAAQTLIAELYWNGLGVARNRKEALDWYRFGAEGGNREAQFAYGNILLRGKLVPLDKKAGREWLEKAAGAGHVRAAFNLAQLITAARPTWAGFKKALPWYEQAANAGLPDAQYALANMYAEAKGIPYNDEKKARELLEKAARSGFDTAQLEYGIWLVIGRGGPKDEKAALGWMQRAAAQQNVIAQNRLARMYAYGVGTDTDAILAGAWHIISRRAGFSDSKLDRFFQKLSEIDKKRAIEAANQLGKRISS